jgi:predicted DCC family thiol-disulfide oxidoreductase YuxK
MTQPVLLYDGVCALCNHAVKFVLARDPDGSMLFAPLHGEYAQAVLARHPELRRVDSLILVAHDAEGAEKTHVRSAAALEVAAYLGGGWGLLRRLLSVIPRPIRDSGYDIIARHRYRTFGRLESCPVPDPATKARFLD